MFKQFGYMPKIDLNRRISDSKLSTEQTMLGSIRLSNHIEQPETTDFKGVMLGLVEHLNKTTKEPDKVMNDAILGNADIHDVMLAMSKAELNVNIATQMTTKIVQTYDKIMQIQV